MKSFDEVFDDKTKYGTKIKTDEYHESGLHPIIDQGQSEIAGYTDLEDGIFLDVPAIIFGDHTRVVKYVDIPFFLGADGVKVLKSKLPNANHKYLYYALKHAKIPNTGYNRHFKWLKEIQIAYPNETTQRDIVEVLDKTAAIIESRQQELQKLDELVKARFVEMFSKKYECVPMGDCTTFIDYRGGTPKLTDGATIRMVNAKSVGNGFFRYVDEYITEELYNTWMHRGFPNVGDVLFTTEGATFGNCCLIPDNLGKFAMGQRVIAICGDNRLLNRYLLAYMMSSEFKQKINEFKGGGTAQGIRSKDLVKVTIPIPPIEEQNEFATFSEHIDKSTFAVQKALDEARLLFDSLMQKYFG